MFGSTNQLKKIQKVKISKMTNIPRLYQATYLKHMRNNFFQSVGDMMSFMILFPNNTLRAIKEVIDNGCRCSMWS